MYSRAGDAIAIAIAILELQIVNSKQLAANEWTMLDELSLPPLLPSLSGPSSTVRGLKVLGRRFVSEGKLTRKSKKKCTVVYAPSSIT
jgi:hypothetical protein